MNLATLAFRNLRRRPLRTSLSILGIALAVGSCLALVALSHSIEDSTRVGLNEHEADLVVSQRGAPDFFGGFLTEDYEDRIAKVPGVARATGELVLFAPAEGDRRVLASGRRETSLYWANVPLREGRRPQPGERKVVLMGDAAAEALGKKLGDEIEVFGEEFRIIAITKFSSIANRNIVLFLLPDLQDATYRPQQVTMIHVTLQRGLSEPQIERVKQDITGLGRVTVSMTSEVLSGDRNFAVLKAVSQSVSSIAIVMGVMFVLNTLLMTIQERTREIGIVAAIGWSDSLIMASIVVEGMIMCALGCALGVVFGYLASFSFKAVPTIGQYINFQPSLSLILPTIVATFVLCLIGSLYPAWRAVRLKPAAALQRL
jgi:putative ABC transport system permease protein